MDARSVAERLAAVRAAILVLYDPDGDMRVGPDLSAEDRRFQLEVLRKAFEVGIIREDEHAILRQIVVLWSRHPLLVRELLCSFTSELVLAVHAPGLRAVARWLAEGTEPAPEAPIRDDPKGSHPR